MGTITTIQITLPLIIMKYTDGIQPNGKNNYNSDNTPFNNYVVHWGYSTNNVTQ